MTNSITKLPKVGVQLPERRAAMHLYARQYYVQVWGNGFTRKLFTGFS